MKHKWNYFLPLRVNYNCKFRLVHVLRPPCTGEVTIFYIFLQITCKNPPCCLKLSFFFLCHFGTERCHGSVVMSHVKFWINADINIHARSKESFLCHDITGLTALFCRLDSCIMFIFGWRLGRKTFFGGGGGGGGGLLKDTNCYRELKVISKMDIILQWRCLWTNHPSRCWSVTQGVQHSFIWPKWIIMCRRTGYGFQGPES